MEEIMGKEVKLGRKRNEEKIEEKKRIKKKK